MADNAKGRLKQSHRTILFEEFTLEDTNKLDAMLANSEADDDELMLEIKKLEVFSFDEFLQKFCPVVYEYQEPLPGGKGRFRYVLSNPPSHAVPVKITDNSFYKMMMDLYNKKASDGSANLEFDFADILKQITPAEEIEAIYDSRRALQYAAQKCEEKQKNNENPAAEIKSFLGMFKHITEKYKTSRMGLMPIAIADINEKIKTVDSLMARRLETGDGENAALPAAGYMDFDNTGRIVFKELESGAVAGIGGGQNQKAITQGELQENIRKRIGSDYDKTMGNSGNEFTRELVVSAYAPMKKDDSGLATLDSAQLALKREEYLEIKTEREETFAQAKTEFISALTAVIEKLIGVKSFFDQATGNLNNKHPDLSLNDGGLIVANCQPAKLVREGMISKFSTFMYRLGVENQESKVWFGILPHVDSGNQSSKLKVSADAAAKNIFEMTEEDLVEEESFQTVVDFKSAKQILGIMNDARITTVFNFAPTQATTFSGLKEKNLDEARKKLEGLQGNSHAVYAYPNFTLLNERKVPLEKGSPVSIEVGPVYVDASYPAAGLLAGSQIIKSLQNYGFSRSRFLPDNLCTRIDLENDGISSKLLTNFNCERLSKTSEGLRKNINEDSFGFLFSGDKKFDPEKGEYLKQTYVAHARSMAQKNGVYQPVFSTLMKDFIWLYLHTNGTPKARMVTNFIRTAVEEWKQEKTRSANRPEDQSIINILIHDGDEISHDDDNPGRINVKFGNVEETVDVEIVETD